MPSRESDGAFFLLISLLCRILQTRNYTFVRYLHRFVCNRKFVVNMEKNEKMHGDKSSSKHKTTVNSTTCDTKGGGKCGEKPHKTPEHHKPQK